MTFIVIFSVQLFLISNLMQVVFYIFTLHFKLYTLNSLKWKVKQYKLNFICRKFNNIKKIGFKIYNKGRDGLLVVLVLK